MRVWFGTFLFLHSSNHLQTSALQLNSFTNLQGGLQLSPLPVRFGSGGLALNTLHQRSQNGHFHKKREHRSTTVYFAQPATDGDIDDDDANVVKPGWSHSDIEWRLRPSPETSRWRRILVRAAAKAIRLECRLLRNPVPPILCPKGGAAVLEAYKGRKKIARFGITTTRGPPEPIITQTIEEIYNITVPFNGAGVAAIIYMFVEPDYRKFGIGDLAIEVISAIHTVQNIDFTVLVADDNGSGKLVAWYEKNGFATAPGLQDLFGSPGGQFGATMIRPVQMTPDFFERCTIKWW